MKALSLLVVAALAVNVMAGNAETVPVEQNATTPVDQNATLPVDQNATVPVDQNATVPVDQNATVEVKPTPAPSTSDEKPTPAPSAAVAACIEVSVEHDATYCISGPICSGSGDAPAGSKCPVAGDVAIKDCHDYLPSFDKSKSSCVAPVDAVCQKIKTGAWGCVLGGKPTPAPSTVEEKPTPAPSTVLDATVPVDYNSTASNSTVTVADENVTVPVQAAVEVALSAGAEGVAGTSGSSIGLIAGVVAAAAALVGAAVYAVKRRRTPEQPVVNESPVSVAVVTPTGCAHRGSFIQV